MQALGPRQHGLNAWRRVERGFDSAFGSARNPLRHLGAIGVFAFVVLAVTGIVLYALFDTSVQGAARSIGSLDALPLATGRLLRGVHRFAADLMVIAMALHLLREWLHGHDHGFRRFSWLTGVPLIAFVFTAAIGGFWLNWDALGQYSAVAAAEWIDSLPLLGSPLARNFLGGQSVSDRLFSLFVFVHIGVPLLLLFGLWFHVQRIARPAWLPPRSLLWGTTAVLTLLALALPIAPHAAARPDRVASALHLDWIILFVHPLADAMSGAVLWAAVGAATLALLAAPFVPWRRERPAVAVVDADNCNGCRRCFVDCPYAAITMAPHPNQRIGRSLAVVDADLCAGCGICAGACPSSTPFRSSERLVTGIDMPQLPVDALRARLRREIAASASGEQRIVRLHCAHGAKAVAIRGVIDLELLCTGQLPPSFVEYALRDGVVGVVVAACREGGCEFRFGERWTAERLARAREPHLRASVPAKRVALVYAGPGDETLLARATRELQRAATGHGTTLTPAVCLEGRGGGAGDG
jgi:ferredoxin/coenzyme F420-reducing hydrogenase delta subunit